MLLALHFILAYMIFDFLCNCQQHQLNLLIIKFLFASEECLSSSQEEFYSLFRSQYNVLCFKLILITALGNFFLTFKHLSFFHLFLKMLVLLRFFDIDSPFYLFKVCHMNFMLLSLPFCCQDFTS